MLAFLLAAPPSYRIVDLGLPPGAQTLEAIALNNRGEVLARVPLRWETEAGKTTSIFPDTAISGVVASSSTSANPEPPK